MRIRRARYSDSPALRELTRQLGYLLSLKQIQENLKKLSQAKEHRVWVAVDSETEEVIGMLHARVILALNLHRNGEGYAAAVNETVRSQGVGSALIATMEKWLKQQGCNRILLITNAKRKRAHKLYKKRGYKQISTSKKYEKWI